MGNIWQSILDVFHRSLVFLHDGLDGIFGEAAWGWAIIGLTVFVRVLLLPLAIKQTRSMRAMQALQPKIKKLQEKYKVDKDLMRKDPETYRARKSKLNEEMMALYREEGVNPASGCLPLLLQAPIFFALFRVLNDQEFSALQNADFYFFTDFVSGDGVSGLGAAVSAAGWPGWLLIALMAGTMFWSQRQMMARNNPEGAQAQQQKIMMYAMPVFLGFVSLNFPMGVLLYWVTTNLWQMGQQAVILAEVRHEGGGDGSASNPAKGGGPSAGGSGPAKRTPPKGGQRPSKGSSSPKSKPDKGDGKRSRGRDHLPRRGDAASS